MAFDEYAFVTRVLCDVSCRSQSVELFGERYASPFGIAPMGIAALSTYRGDLALARAAHAVGHRRGDERHLAHPHGGSRPGLPRHLVPGLPAGRPGTHRRADRPREPGGFQDPGRNGGHPHLGQPREQCADRIFHAIASQPTAGLGRHGASALALRHLLRTLMRHGMPHFENSFATRGAPILSANVLRDFSARDNLSWQHMAAIRRRWPGALVVKGILSLEDARIARQVGADGVILSNHGGRQLDGAASPMRVLAQAVDALGPDYPVMIDGGFRRGSDVLKAVALGARMVFVGRPFNYAARRGRRGGRAALPSRCCRAGNRPEHGDAGV